MLNQFLVFVEKLKSSQIIVQVPNSHASNLSNFDVITWLTHFKWLTYLRFRQKPIRKSEHETLSHYRLSYLHVLSLYSKRQLQLIISICHHLYLMLCHGLVQNLGDWIIIWRFTWPRSKLTIHCGRLCNHLICLSNQNAFFLINFIITSRRFPFSFLNNFFGSRLSFFIYDTLCIWCSIIIHTVRLNLLLWLHHRFYPIGSSLYLGLFITILFPVK